MSKTYIYHYSARYSVNNGTADMDGIARLRGKVLCQDDYSRLKKLIAPDDFDRTTIVSLSLISVEENK